MFNITRTIRTKLILCAWFTLCSIEVYANREFRTERDFDMPNFTLCGVKAARMAYKKPERREDIACPIYDNTTATIFRYDEASSNKVVARWVATTFIGPETSMIAFRGSDSLGDFGRDIQSQGTENLKNPYCDRGRDWDTRVGKGWAIRVRNNKAPILKTLRAINNQDAGAFSTTIFAGHSLGAVSAQLAAHHFANCLGSGRSRNHNFRVEAFNPPRMTADQATLGRMRSVVNSSGFNLHQWNRTGDPVHAVPLNMQHIIWNNARINWNAGGSLIRSNADPASFAYLADRIPRPRISVPWYQHELTRWEDGSFSELRVFRRR